MKRLFKGETYRPYRLWYIADFGVVFTCFLACFFCFVYLGCHVQDLHFLGS
ncbi:MAG: hypothetical protein LBJ00_10445 [Planctomycetaceae bacterium]|nr:hypothetical protein [Planctomycetaceae bacterium]